MIRFGDYNDLLIERETPQGLYLKAQNGEEEVLLPWKFVPNGWKIGDEIEVFAYKDHKHRPIATSQEAAITLHKFAYLPVKATSDHGAFLDWGLEKDLFVPFREQGKKLEVGKSYLVYLYVDKQTERLVASSKPRRFLSKQKPEFEANEEVDLVFWEVTDLGIRVIVNHQYEGMIYKNELFQRIRLGDTAKGYIKKVRDDDKLDISLQPHGYQQTDQSVIKILKLLQQSEGYLALHDKSDPEEIKAQLQMSKKSFKKAIGALYKQKKIRIESDGVYLNE